MGIKDKIKKILAHPNALNLDLDSFEASQAHSRIIREKKFLNKLYRHYYSYFNKAHQSVPDGLRIEFGSGSGFLNEIIPDVLRVDLRQGSMVDILASATKMPFADNSVGAIFMLNVMHHISDVDQFFIESHRVLCSCGKIVLIEPYNSALSRFIYSSLHHEPFMPVQKDWSLPSGGPMSQANGALPWIVFIRDRLIFEKKYPELSIKKITPHTVFMYLASGGVSMRAFLPGFAFRPLLTMEKLLLPAGRFLASMMTVELEKQ